jgi:hypothetical protein
MRYSISDTAEFGDLTRGPRVIDDLVREQMKQLLEEIQSARSRASGSPRWTPASLGSASCVRRLRIRSSSVSARSFAR